MEALQCSNGEATDLTGKEGPNGMAMSFQSVEWLALCHLVATALSQRL